MGVAMLNLKSYGIKDLQNAKSILLLVLRSEVSLSNAISGIDSILASYESEIFDTPVEPAPPKNPAFITCPKCNGVFPKRRVNTNSANQVDGGYSAVSTCVTCHHEEWE